MPGRQKIQVRGFDEARRKLKDIKDNALRERTIVSAAKKNAKPVLADMKEGFQPIDPEMTTLLGIKKIPSKYGGKEWPGAWAGVKKKNEFTRRTSSGGVMSIYWIEYGTQERKHKTTSRKTGKFPKFAPMRSAIKRNHMSVRKAFRNELIGEINKRIRQNKI